MTTTREVIGTFEGEPIHTVVELVRRRAKGDYGQLLLGRDRLFYLGDRRIEFPLSECSHVDAGYDDEGYALTIRRAGKARVTKFWFDLGRESVAELLKELVRAAQSDQLPGPGWEPSEWAPEWVGVSDRG